ncbi:hypothetical protein QRX60_31915 [Amycolatopsis mongoliensis]|uniref:Uncharacterized protein n=1 Tax=Amycolatopsis mongoliensis TaxID=715475 RepID=A0A9Y2JJK3_9PSEU|nr:hypothetical protein [Amycolatopsis sp. 4-36]WIX98655.1 hypothetical protein QRX60_31915 [Amycolatopsis sp. 4-36]
MTSYGIRIRDELRVPTRELRHAIPSVYAGYKELHDAAVRHGASPAEAAEAIGVTFLMNGAPAYAAFVEFHSSYADMTAQPGRALTGHQHLRPEHGADVAGSPV